MRRFALLLICAALLWGCAAQQAETTAPPQTTAAASLPPETTLPPETSAPAVSASVPIHADYAEETFNAYYAYWCEETDYITSIGFTPAETLTEVEFSLLTWNESEHYDAEILYTIDAMDPDRPFLAQVTFWGDMTTYGISFTDAAGQRRHYAIMISGKDGSLLCTEYTP